MEQKQTKDYWNLAYRNFIQLFYFGWVIILLLCAFAYFSNNEQLRNIFFNAPSFILFVGISGCWFYLALLLKRRDKKAIPFGYVFLSVMLVWNLLQSPNIISILVFGYFLHLVYKTSKTDPSTESSIPQNLQNG